MQSQIAAPQPPVKRTNPALAVVILAGLAIIIGGAFVLTKDDGKSGGSGPFAGGQPGVDAPQATSAPAQPTSSAATPNPSRTPSLTDGPIVAPGYKMTAIFVPPQGSNDMSKMDKRLYDAIVAGVDWNDSAKLYGRRYPLQYVFQNATTNLLLRPPNPDESKRLLTAAGFGSSRPKFLLTFNASDSVFASWLTQQISNLGYNVVTDPNSFTAQERAQGYHGIIIAILPA